MLLKCDKLLKNIGNLLNFEIEAITIGPIIIYSTMLSEVTKRHEEIHCAQYADTLYIFFPIIYIYDYCKNRVSGLGPDEAYRNIRAEKEAYDNEERINYIKTRKRWVWLL
jgi:hypothetical protein